MMDWLVVISGTPKEPGYTGAFPMGEESLQHCLETGKPPWLFLVGLPGGSYNVI